MENLINHFDRHANYYFLSLSLTWLALFSILFLITGLNIVADFPAFLVLAIAYFGIAYTPLAFYLHERIKVIRSTDPAKEYRNIKKASKDLKRSCRRIRHSPNTSFADLERQIITNEKTAEYILNQIAKCEYMKAEESIPAPRVTYKESYIN
jgi:hypothetical protein